MEATYILVCIILKLPAFFHLSKQNNKMQWLSFSMNLRHSSRRLPLLCRSLLGTSASRLQNKRLFSQSGENSNQQHQMMPRPNDVSVHSHRVALLEALQLREQLVATSPEFLQETAIAEASVPRATRRSVYNYNFNGKYVPVETQQDEKKKANEKSNFDVKALNRVVTACRAAVQRRAAVPDYDIASSHLLTSIADTFTATPPGLSCGPGRILEGRRLTHLEPLSAADTGRSDDEASKSTVTGLDGVSFKRADLRGSHLCSYNSFTNCNFEHIDGRGAIFAGSEFRWCTFTAAALERAEFCDRNAVGPVKGCYFAHCRFDRAALVGANLRGCTFYACDFTLCDLTKAIVDDTTLFQGPEGWSICRRGTWSTQSPCLGPKVMLQGGAGHGLPMRRGTEGKSVGIGVLPY